MERREIVRLLLLGALGEKLGKWGFETDGPSFDIMGIYGGHWGTGLPISMDSGLMESLGCICSFSSSAYRYLNRLFIFSI